MTRLIVKGGTIVDGALGAPEVADVVVSGDQIVAIQESADIRPGDQVLDASNCIVAPGFVDIHSHSDYTLAVDPRAQSALSQGVTTEVVGNCGHGCFPIESADLASRAIYGYNPVVDAFKHDAAAYLEFMRDVSPAVNLATLTPHGQMRLSVLGATSRKATQSEHQRMRQLLDESLQQGSWGFSTGLEYAIERAASVDEIVDLCTLVASHSGLYATHTRFRNEGAERGVAEAIEVARRSGCRVQVSHLVPRGGYEQTLRCLDMVETAYGDGIDIQFDMHTRLHGYTYLHVGVPAHLLDGKPSEIQARLASKSARSEIKDYRAMFNFEKDADRIILSTGLPQYSGQSLRAVSQEMDLSSLDCALAILMENSHRLDQIMVNLPTYTQQQQELAFSHPLGVPASDATTLCTDGPLGSTYFPGAFSWAAYAFSLLYRLTGDRGLPETIAKLTSQPAARAGLPFRGTVRPGSFADLAVFEPGLLQPVHSDHSESPAIGMRHVVVNGVAAVVDGRYSGRRTGRALLSVGD